MVINRFQSVSSVPIERNSKKQRFSRGFVIYLGCWKWHGRYLESGRREFSGRNSEKEGCIRLESKRSFSLFPRGKKIRRARLHRRRKHHRGWMRSRSIDPCHPRFRDKNVSPSSCPENCIRASVLLSGIYDREPSSSRRYQSRSCHLPLKHWEHGLEI